MTPGRLVYLGSLLVSFVLALLLIPQDATTFTIVLGVLGAFAVAGLFAPQRASRLLLSLGVLNLLTVAPELGLRVSGFTYASGIQFGYPKPYEFWQLVPDEELFWLLPKDDPIVNSLGFIGDEPEVPKPAGVARLLLLGDSCLQQHYPESVGDMVESLLREADDPIDVVNLSMSGYSTHQGLALAERYGARLEPDVVVVYYGWNDHWLAYGAVDREKRSSLRGERLYRRSRLLQLVRKTTLAWGLKEKVVPLDDVRVPAAHYRENLEAIVARFDVPVVLITAPTSHRQLGVPDYLVDEGFARDKASAIALHDEYNAIVRAVAAATPAHLLDLDQRFTDGEDLRTLFTGQAGQGRVEDGIHLSDVGRWTVARHVADFVRERGLLP